MKTKLVISLTAGLVLALVWTALALADNGPHGGYTALTDACAGCHRAHTAGAANLLLEAMPQLCYTCHGAAGAGADTNVEDGLYLERDGIAEVPPEGVNNRALKGGGFVNATMDTNWDGAAAAAATTSNHLADGSTGTAWGNGAVGAGAMNFALSCTSCHDPHGGANGGGATYRILRVRPTGSGAGSDVVVTDEANKLYTLTDNADKSGNQYFGEGYGFVNFPGDTWAPLDVAESQLAGWCSQCHTRYMQAPGAGFAGSVSTGDPIFTYRHRSSGTPATCFGGPCHTTPPNMAKPMAYNSWGGPLFSHRLSCMTCHVAHGSSASAAGYAGSTAFVPWPDGALAPSGDNRSSLLRVDNRGVCELCHGK